jgi:hypothetical protein
MNEVDLSFEFRGKQRQAKARIIKENFLLFEVIWDEDDLIWHFGKRFYVTDSHITLIGKQRPPSDAKNLHQIAFGEIMKHKEDFSI